MSKTYYITVRTVVEERYEVRAPTAKQAMLPIHHLLEFPKSVLSAKAEIVNVVAKKRSK